MMNFDIIKEIGAYLTLLSCSRSTEQDLQLLAPHDTLEVLFSELVLP